MTLSLDIDLQPANNLRLATLCGPLNQHLRQIESRMGVEINNRGQHFQITGESAAVTAASEVLQALYKMAEHEDITAASIHLFLQESGVDALVNQTTEKEPASIKIAKGSIKGRGPHQIQYLRDIQTHDLSLAIGPAGTGKTYLAVASAVEALEAERVRRLVLVRPAVEAGEHLGFLPGDLAQKIDPYLRPMYDALYEMLGFEKVARLIERHVIEIAPLAYMRGRTLNDAFIILDEAQNTTREQMKMFLTRIGFGSTTVVTGDITQVDLPRDTQSGLRHAVEVLKDVDGVAMTFFTAQDVVRHPLVQRIVMAYDRHENQG